MDAHLEKLISGKIPVLLDMYADWCEPCKWVTPVLDVVDKHFNGTIHIHKVDIDKHPELAKTLLIRSVPTLILFVSGKEVWRMRGFEVAPDLIKIIEKYVS